MLIKCFLYFYGEIAILQLRPEQIEWLLTN